LRESARLLETRPSDPDIMALRAATLLAHGQAQAAVDVLEPAARDASAPFVVTSGLAICQAAAGDHAGALANARRALDQHADEYSLRLLYGELLDRQGQPDLALQQLFRAIRDAQVRGRWLNDASTPVSLRLRVRRAIERIDSGRQALFERVLQPHIAAFGPDAMLRVGEALGVYLGLFRPTDPDPRQRPTFLLMPGLRPTPMFGRERFPWYAALEGSTAAIRDDLRGVLNRKADFTPFLEIPEGQDDAAYLGGADGERAWDAFFFYRHGTAFPDHLAACPATAAALSQVPLTRIDGHAPEVLFSVLAPRTHIKPHHGVTNTRVVTHLPLVIPKGDCKLVVGGEAHAWEEGRCVTFDDTFLHEAWNRSDETRVVLILDTWHPDLSEPEQIALRGLVEAIGAFNSAAGVA
jgi:aspartyl/asparaginyl beta-hydroxylase (cupin superfamily)